MFNASMICEGTFTLMPFIAQFKCFIVCMLPTFEESIFIEFLFNDKFFRFVSPPKQSGIDVILFSSSIRECSLCACTIDSGISCRFLRELGNPFCSWSSQKYVQTLPECYCRKYLAALNCSIYRWIEGDKRVYLRIDWRWIALPVCMYSLVSYQAYYWIDPNIRDLQVDQY